MKISMKARPLNRDQRLTKTDRSEIARKGVQERWKLRFSMLAATLAQGAGKRVMKPVLPVAAVVALVTLGVSSSFAQNLPPAPAPQTSDYLGTWSGAIDWHDVEGYDDPNARWELRADGTFVDGYGDTGSWTVGADGYVTLQYRGGGEARYTGTIMGGLLFGAGLTSNESFSATFAFTRSR